MKKIWNKNTIGFIFVIISMSVLLVSNFSFICSAGSTHARTDKIDDICRRDMASSEKQCNQSVDSLDIFKIARGPIDEEGMVYLTMVVTGKIEEDDDVHYVIWYNNSRSKYKMDYSNGTNLGGARNIEDENFTAEVQEPVVTNQTITVVYPLLNASFPNENIEAIAYKVTSDYTYFDVVPNEKKAPIMKEINLPGHNSTNDSTTDFDESTPGFSLILFFIAFLIGGLIMMKSRKL